jgi:hypothetical protein
MIYHKNRPCVREPRCKRGHGSRKVHEYPKTRKTREVQVRLREKGETHRPSCPYFVHSSCSVRKVQRLKPRYQPARVLKASKEECKSSLYLYDWTARLLEADGQLVKLQSTNKNRLRQFQYLSYNATRKVLQYLLRYRYCMSRARVKGAFKASCLWDLNATFRQVAYSHRQVAYET